MRSSALSVPSSPAAPRSRGLSRAGHEPRYGEEGRLTTPGSILKGGSGLAGGTGDNQTAPAGAAFPPPLSVTVFTPDGKKCNGCVVQWALSPGQFTGGVISTKTDVTGVVLFNVSSLSPRGTYQVRATIANGQSVTFTLIAS
jgi:hypothetical protein